MRLLNLSLHIILFSQFGLTQVVDLKRFTEPPLQEGQCHTLVDSKVYLSDIKDPKKERTMTHIIHELGEENLAHIENTETESYFFCKVKCHLKSENQFLWITAKDKNERMKHDINAFVCPGLSVESVRASETLSIKTTVPMIIEATQSTLPEVHVRLKSISYKITGPRLGKMIADFFTALKTVQIAYAGAQSPSFQEAAAELALYSPESPDAWPLLKNKVSTLDEKGFQLKDSLLDYSKGSDLVDLFFLINGRFLQYVD